MCLYVPEKQPENSLHLCSTDQLTVKVIQNCDMSFFAEN